MALTREQVKHVAELAKLKLTEAEVDLFQKQLSAVLDAGECGSEPTTVVDWSSGEPEVLRAGAGDPQRFQ